MLTAFKSKVHQNKTSVTTLNFNSIHSKLIFQFKECFVSTQSDNIRAELIQSIHKQVGITTPCDEFDNTLVHFIVKYGSLTNINFTLKLLSVVEIDARNGAGQTALMQAISDGKQSVTSLLLSYGADPLTLDKRGHVAYDYAATSPKLIYLKANNIVPLLEDLNHKINSLQTAEDFQSFLIWLSVNRLSLVSPISRSDNTVLHLLVCKIPLCVMVSLINKTPLTWFGTVNAKGETPLDSLINLNLSVKTKILAVHGAPTAKYSQKPIFAGHSLFVYLEANRLLTQLITTLNIVDVCQRFDQLGLRLDEPIDEYDNTALHILAKRLPTIAFRDLLLSIPNCSLLQTNSGNQTIMDVAAENYRLPMMQMLHEKFGLNSPRAYENLYNHYIRKTRFPSLHEYFDRCFKKANVTKLDHNRKVEFYFKEFVAYIRKSWLRYHGTNRDGSYLLDCEYGERYQVNCYDLASAFGYLLISNGISDVQIHHYTKIKSRPFNDKGLIHGDFVCFDDEYHQNYYAHAGFFIFEDHYVLRVGSRFFDPTFCCYYNNENDLLSLLNKITIDFNYTTVHPINMNFKLNLTFIAGMNALFNNSEWKYEFFGESLLISKGSIHIKLKQRVDHAHFSSEGLTALQMSQVISLWYKTRSPIIPTNVNVNSSNTQDVDFLQQELNKASEWFKPFKKRVLQ